MRWLLALRRSLRLGAPYGLTLYGRDIPPDGLEGWNRPSSYWLGLRVKRYVRDPSDRRQASEQVRYALSNISLAENAYGLGGLTHELGHVLHLADHYYSQDADGKQGPYSGTPLIA